MHFNAFPPCPHPNPPRHANCKKSNLPASAGKFDFVFLVLPGHGLQAMAFQAMAFQTMAVQAMAVQAMAKSL